jgi:hypothetical protein
MLVEKYSQSLAGIKTELSRYSHFSVFNCALKHLHPTGSKDSVGTMPWVIMFLLKISLQGNNGSLNVSAREFVLLANKVFKLGDHLIDMPGKTFLLMVRSMIAQQLWYQISPGDACRYIYLQKTLLDRSKDVNERLFCSRSGISLQDYYKITIYLLSQAGKQSANSVIRFGLTSFYSHLSPKMSDDTLIGFLKLVALPFSKLPIYMKKFVVKDSNSAELYQETPLKNKPIILEEGGLVIFNAGLCISGLKTIALDLLKGDDSFTDRFGDDVESYVGERLKITPLDVYTMGDLKGLITIKSGNIADYVISDGQELIVFESKSITPNVLMKCAYDPQHLSKLLNESFIKGITQGQETAHKLSASEKFLGMRARVIIVTLDDFFIYGGEFVGEFINESLEADLINEYGTLPVPMADVLYMTLQDLIVLTEWLKDKPKNAIFTFLDQLAAKKIEAGGARFSLAQHISEHIQGADIRGDVGMEDTVVGLMADMESLIVSNATYWRAQHPVTFMRAFDRFQQRLLRSYI